MGSVFSRSGRANSEEADQSEAGAYRYPPKSGASFFSNHFIMGGEKFESPQPDSFLFGENGDLNFLAAKPAAFPYPPPQSSEPTKTLKSLINVRRDSLHFVKRGEDDYNVEFTFDADVKCSVTLYASASEEMTPQGVAYRCKAKSETYRFKRGAGIKFSEPEFRFEPSKYSDEELNIATKDGVPNYDVMPVVIHCVSEEGDEFKQSHATVAYVEKNSEGGYALKAAKQKIFVDGLSYLLQEIYGLENKTAEKDSEDDGDDCGAECVVCMCDLRDTIILPCRHLCLCNACADSLRYQASNCPICRAPFRALLQIRALQKVNNSHPAIAAGGHDDGVPPGYVSASLVEALNGPLLSPPAPVVLQQQQQREGRRRHRKKGKKAPKATMEDDDDEEPPTAETEGETALQIPEVNSVSLRIVDETTSGDLNDEEEAPPAAPLSSASSSSTSQDELIEQELSVIAASDIPKDATDENRETEERIASVIGKLSARGSPVSLHSSQESSASSASTKRLLPEPPIPECRVKIVNVLPKEDELEDKEEDKEAPSN